MTDVVPATMVMLVSPQFLGVAGPLPHNLFVGYKIGVALTTYDTWGNSPVFPKTQPARVEPKKGPPVPQRCGMFRP